MFGPCSILDQQRCPVGCYTYPTAQRDGFSDFLRPNAGRSIRGKSDSGPAHDDSALNTYLRMTSTSKILVNLVRIHIVSRPISLAAVEYPLNARVTRHCCFGEKGLLRQSAFLALNFPPCLHAGFRSKANCAWNKTVLVARLQKLIDALGDAEKACAPQSPSGFCFCSWPIHLSSSDIYAFRRCFSFGLVHHPL